MRLQGAGFSRPVKQPTRVTHLAGGVDIYLRRFKLLCFSWLRWWDDIGRRIGKAFFARCVSRMGAGGQGAGNSISLGGREGTAPASDPTPDSEAVVWVVVVGLGFQAIEDSIGSPLILV
jgi:hypothetical protein